MKIRDEYTCPLELTHDITKGKWKPIILWQLGKCKMSLAQLESSINGINQKMLIEQLKELQAMVYTRENLRLYSEVIRC